MSSKIGEAYLEGLSQHMLKRGIYDVYEILETLVDMELLTPQKAKEVFTLPTFTKYIGTAVQSVDAIKLHLWLRSQDTEINEIQDRLTRLRGELKKLDDELFVWEDVR